MGFILASNRINEIRSQIFKELGYTCSAGISVNKMLAKISTSMNKPNNQTIILP